MDSQGTSASNVILCRNDLGRTMYGTCPWKFNCRSSSLVRKHVIPSYLRQWTIQVQSIFAGVLLILILFTVPETYAPKLAQQDTKTNADPNAPSLTKRIGIALQRPFRISVQCEINLGMLFFEPIVLSLAIYVAFMYGVIFLFLLIIPLTFSHHRNADTLTANLPLLSFTAGFILYLPIVPFVNRIYRARPAPETRLLSVIVAAIVFPISLFWWAWTAPYASIHWIIPTLAGVPFAMASLAVWLGICDYLVDLYDEVGWGASALAANTVLRSSFAGCFPLFGNGMPSWVRLT
jgi:MFS transporter, DHA1 family, multidrug resistance protein